MSGATFNLFVRGEDWLYENEPSLPLRTSANNDDTATSVDDDSVATNAGKLINNFMVLLCSILMVLFSFENKNYFHELSRLSLIDNIF